MKCRYCNAEIEPGELYCKNCGKEVRIVPDYNPMDDVLEAQIKDSLEGREPSKSADPLRRAKDTRKAEALKKKAARKRKRRIAIAAVLSGLVLIAVISVVIYQNSYTGIVGKGDKALAAGNYSQAVNFYNKAINKKPKVVKAYESLANAYMAQNLPEDAENVYLDAIKVMPDDKDIYESAIHFYLDNEEAPKVTELLADAPSSIQDKLSSYIIGEPEFSLDDSQVYDSVQQLTLESDEETISYTLDGTDPLDNGITYTEPIQINEEGETIISAIAIDKRGIPSDVVQKTYTLTFPVIDPPVVSPSTGQYDTPEEIEIKVPDGCTAYYTLDKSEPTAESQKYEGPVMMPTGNTIFKAVIIDGNQRSSTVTTRNYIVEGE